VVALNQLWPCPTYAQATQPMGDTQEGVCPSNELRWSRLVGQFGGRVKLGSGCCQAASLSITLAPYASSGVRPANVE